MPNDTTLTDSPLPDVTLDELRFLVTILETRNLTTAAGRHDLSMAAASRRLGRLREAFGDELFVRSGLQMLPTSRMRDLVPRIVELVNASRVLFSNGRFDLANTRRRVRVLAADNAVTTILGEAITRFAHDIPNATLEILPLDGRLLERLRTDEADLAIAPLDSVPKDFHRLELYRSRRGVLVREGHPLIDVYAEKGGITLQDMSAFRQIRMNFPGVTDQPGLLPPAADQSIGLSLPYFLAVPGILSGTDYTYTAPVLTLLGFLADPRHHLRMLPAPDELTPFTPCLVWHHATHTDPFLQWVRGVIATSARNEARRHGAVEKD